jgi:hypothetical protein
VLKKILGSARHSFGSSKSLKSLDFATILMHVGSFSCQSGEKNASWNVFGISPPSITFAETLQRAKKRISLILQSPAIHGVFAIAYMSSFEFHLPQWNRS